MFLVNYKSTTITSKETVWNTKLHVIIIFLNNFDSFTHSTYGKWLLMDIGQDGLCVYIQKVLQNFIHIKIHNT